MCESLFVFDDNEGRHTLRCARRSFAMAMGKLAGGRLDNNACSLVVVQQDLEQRTSEGKEERAQKSFRQVDPL